MARAKTGRLNTKGFSFRVSDDVAELIESKISNSGLTATEYFIKSATGQKIENRLIKQADMRAFQQALDELHRVGSNLNQIAHHMNIGEYENKKNIVSALADVQNNNRQLWQSLKAYLQQQD